MPSVPVTTGNGDLGPGATEELVLAAEPVAEAHEAQSEALAALEAQPRSLLARAGARREGAATLADDLQIGRASCRERV